MPYDYDNLSEFAQEEMVDLRAEVQQERKHARLLASAPDCRDPDLPGCPNCEESEDDES